MSFQCLAFRLDECGETMDECCGNDCSLFLKTEHFKLNSIEFFRIIVEKFLLERERPVLHDGFECVEPLGE